MTTREIERVDIVLALTQVGTGLNWTYGVLCPKANANWKVWCSCRRFGCAH
jgi:hypothetical protein